MVIWDTSLDKQVTATSRRHMDTMGASRPLPTVPKDSLSAAIEAISVSTELVEEELKPYLDAVLNVAMEGKKGISEQVEVSSILPVLAQILRRKSTLTTHTARLVAELARDGLQQERFLRLGAVPRMVSVLLQHGKNEALRSSCLLALCNLADMGEEDGSMLFWEEGAKFGEGDYVFRGTSRHAFGFSSAVTVVRLKQWTNGQYSVAVEVLQRCSKMFWGAKNGHQNGLPNLSHLGSCPKLYKVFKCSVKNIPRNRNLRSAVLHTLL
ncbi:hypothetical protein DNTS_008443 [Danionella cerebrum]|uniref:Uncharacterized protein n=1 Tax=Danionella cerebrum TaxID=2873325 RepID=A0A553QX58_9TELE|nr:hypothetical protein DNTS_008443 [Danionella translucida]TRY94541.1 hypothetical protein DNTS_008443 [Danionella translucida]